jgi:hypothetical protein
MATNQDRDIRRILEMLEVLGDTFRQERAYMRDFLAFLETRIGTLEGILDGFTEKSSVALNWYEDVPSRFGQHTVHGGLTEMASGVLQTGSPFTFDKGAGKIMLHTSSTGASGVGTITILGDSVDRTTGEVTEGDTEVFELSDHDSGGTRITVDSNGDNRFNFEQCLMSAKWWQGEIEISTDTYKSQTYAYHVSYEQANDTPGLTLDSYDVNLYTASAAPGVYFTSQIYTVVLDTDTGFYNVTSVCDMQLDTPYADVYHRLRHGNIDIELDGSTDGFFTVFNHGRLNNPDVVDITAKVWIRVEGEPIAITIPPRPGAPPEGPGIPPPPQDNPGDAG